VLQAISKAPDGYYVSVEEARRSLAQNARMWAMLADIAKQVPWQVNGVVGLQAEKDWKDIFSSALRQEDRLARGLRGGFVMLGRRTSEMDVGEMTAMIELMFAFGAEHGVVWSEKSYVPEWVQ
jgi:hypothetical protein